MYGNTLVNNQVRENPSIGSTWARGREKKQDRTTNKKAQQRYISHMWGEAPAKDNATKFFHRGRCTGRNHTCQILF